MTKKLLLLFLLLIPLTLRAEIDPQFGDDIDRSADDFVTVSLVIADPGNVLYSRVGHAALHMQCPTFDLDYIFSYESEDAGSRFLSFLAGKLKMGMFSISVDKYLEGYRQDGRGVREYRLNLPVEARRELWRVLDNSVKKGTDLEYDYLRRGCAQSTLQFLIAGLRAAGYEFEYGPWPEHFNGATRAEIARHFLKPYKWTSVLLSLLTNGIINNTSCSDVKKVIIPSDLVVVLQNAKVDGVRVIDAEPIEIIAGKSVIRPFPVSPMVFVAILLVLLIIFRMRGSYAGDYILLGLQTILGVATVYLVVFSSLVCTEWSPLIVPLNPLPLIFWKWRRFWQIPYAAILIVWSALMLFWPHQLTDPVYIAFAIILALSYIPVRTRQK